MSPKKKPSTRSNSSCTALATATTYANNVIGGTIPACKLIKQAAERFLRDLDTQKFVFDEKAAQHVVDFFAFLRPSKGEWASKPLELLPWQVFVLANIFGFKRDDGSRRFRLAYIEVPRKNGKSTLLSGIGLYMLVADGEAGAEVYSAACTKEQAKITYDEAVQMRKNNPSLASKIQSFRTGLTVQATNSKFQALASEDSTLDGLNSHCILIDELHEHPNRKLYDVLEESTSSRRQPLTMAITTAGYNRESICFVQNQYAQKILTRVVDDDGSDAFFAFIATVDEGDEAKWADPIVWQKANPSLGTTKRLDYMERKVSEVKEVPSALNGFLRKQLDIWTQSETRFLPADYWDLCNGTEDEFPDTGGLRDLWLEKLKGRECYGGLDLSTTTDLSAFVLLFPPCFKLQEQVPDPTDKAKKITVVHREADDKYRALAWFWIPGDNIEKRCKRDRVPYEVWEREGFVHSTEGNVIDYDFIRAKIQALGKDYSIQEIGYDPYNSTQISIQLLGDGFEMVEFRQGYISMNSPTKELLRLVLSKQIVHLANPVLRWMADNMVVSEDPAGNLKPNKEKSTEKIDGIVALVMALGRATANPQPSDLDYTKMIFAL